MVCDTLKWSVLSGFAGTRNFTFVSQGVFDQNKCLAVGVKSENELMIDLVRNKTEKRDKNHVCPTYKLAGAKLVVAQLKKKSSLEFPHSKS
jgi:hypothetical protein